MKTFATIIWVLKATFYINFSFPVNNEIGEQRSDYEENEPLLMTHKDGQKEKNLNKISNRIRNLNNPSVFVVSEPDTCLKSFCREFERKYPPWISDCILCCLGSKTPLYKDGQLYDQIIKCCKCIKPRCATISRQPEARTNECNDASQSPYPSTSRTGITNQGFVEPSSVCTQGNLRKREKILPEHFNLKTLKKKSKNREFPKISNELAVSYRLKRCDGGNENSDNLNEIEETYL